MAWQEQVPGGFGEMDCEFAVHPMDKQRAQEAIKAAKASGASKADFEKEVVWHCYKQVTAPGALQPHVLQQVKRLNQLWGT